MHTSVGMEELAFVVRMHSMDASQMRLPEILLYLCVAYLQEFHRKYYHPSNARIWFYGDDNPNERLRILSGM